MPFKYLFDENVDPIYVRQLRRQFSELVVRMIGEPATEAT
jgi:hypothetical protein